MDRPTRFVIAWAFAFSEDEAASVVVRKTRERTEGKRGVPRIGDGRGVSAGGGASLQGSRAKGEVWAATLEAHAGGGARPGSEAPPQGASGEG